MLRSTIARLMSRGPEPAPNAQSEPASQDPPVRTAAPGEADGPIDQCTVGLTDAVADGWYNADTGELAPGFAVSEADVVVDVGCGEGGLSSFSARMGARVIMVDMDRDVLNRALQTAAQDGADRVEARLGDAAALPLEDASVTRVICTEVLEHVDDPVRVMRELVRVGRPGALYLVSVPGAAAERLLRHVANPSYFEKPNHVRIFELEEFVALVENAGLVIERQIPYAFFWTMHLLLFWQSGKPFGQGSDPLLDAWSRTWREVMRSKDAGPIRAALNELAPRSIAIVARKPA